MTDVEREQGAFRWDWSIPFESYGIDAYGQVTFQNMYGIGSTSEGAAMAHGEYQLNEDGDVQAEGSVQVKGYHSAEYSVQTQYEVTLYEWDVFVDGRADLMAWDMYLNLGARETQSAYHEYFLAIQVAEGEPFMLDNLNFAANFDTGWYDPFQHELGISLQGMTIGQPYYEQTSNEEEPEEPEEEEEIVEEEDDTATEDPAEPTDDTGHDDMPALSEEGDSPFKSGCATAPSTPGQGHGLMGMLLIALGYRRQKRRG